MANSRFPCTQEELYMACRLGWEACADNLASFTAFKARYTPEFIAARLTEVDVAEAIPKWVTRRDDPNTQMVLLEEIAEDCILYFKMLKRYIADAFPADLIKMKEDAAGQSFFNRARLGTWNIISSLNASAIAFIQDNKTALEKDLNMPADFLTRYQEVRTAYTEQYKKYILSSKDSMNITGESSAANANIYEKLISMFKDAQEIFAKDDRLKNDFTFVNILKYVQAVGVAGLRGTVLLANTKLPIENALISILNTDKSAVTEKAGKYYIPQLANGTYTVMVSAPGFQEVVIPNVSVKKSTYNTLNVSLEPVPIPMEA